MSTRAMRLGAVGAVFEGYHRDTREIVRLGFPVFSLGAYAQDQKDRGRAVDYRCRVTFANGAAVAPGDIIAGDIDGVVVIPKLAAADVVRDALAKVTRRGGRAPDDRRRRADRRHFSPHRDHVTESYPSPRLEP